MPNTKRHLNTNPLLVQAPALLAGMPGLIHRVGLLDEAWTFLAQEPIGSAPKPDAPAKPKPLGQAGAPGYPPQSPKAQGAPVRGPNHQQRRHQGR